MLSFEVLNLVYKNLKVKSKGFKSFEQGDESS